MDRRRPSSGISVVRAADGKAVIRPMGVRTGVSVGVGAGVRR